MQTHYRYERKFYVPELTEADLKVIVKTHRAFFKEIYYKRQVNNIYFDTLKFDNFFDNIDGVRRRKKYRVRWYGRHEDEIANPHLEIKLKNGLVGRKIVLPVDKFKLDASLLNILKNIKTEKKNEEKFQETINFLHPVVLNHYQRSYFRSQDGKFRITIDSDVKFNSITSGSLKKTNTGHSPGCILEIKYGKKDDEQASEISNLLPFRMTKSSKYVDCITRLYPSL